jgi:hypothetical protein
LGIEILLRFLRPITGIRESDAGTGPTGLGDGNPDTVGDPTFSPLGAPASNLTGPNFTPPFPAYPSGHAGFGGALFQTLRRFYGTDDISFTFVSDEFNGVTLDNDGNPRPLLPRSFSSFSQAEEENGQSRIYLGIHWSFDKTEGIMQGRQIADYVFDNVFTPLAPGSKHHSRDRNLKRPRPAKGLGSSPCQAVGLRLGLGGPDFDRTVFALSVVFRSRALFVHEER